MAHLHEVDGYGGSNVDLLVVPLPHGLLIVIHAIFGFVHPRTLQGRRIAEV